MPVETRGNGYRGWDDKKGFVRKPSYRLTSDETDADKEALRRACAQIGIGEADIDDDGENLSVEVTAEGLEELREALQNPQPTSRELQDKRTYERFIDLMS